MKDSTFGKALLSFAPELAGASFTVAFPTDSNNVHVHFLQSASAEVLDRLQKDMTVWMLADGCLDPEARLVLTAVEQ